MDGEIVADQKNDPWASAAAAYKPQPGAQSAPAASSDDWKVWQEKGSSSQAEPEGFLQSLGSSLGITPPTETPSLKDAAISGIGGPVVPIAKSLYQGGKRSAGELKQGIQALASGNPAAGLQHAITAIPVLGPTLDKASDQYADQNYTGEAGTLMGGASQIAPMLVGGLDAIKPNRPTFGEIPTRAKAGKLFDSVMKDAANQPVELTRTNPLLERAMQLSDRGHGTVTPLDKLFQRIQQTQPLDYAEARDRASALSSLTGEDKIRATKTLQAETKNISHAFNQDIGDAAAAVGRGEDYEKAMQIYRQASQLRDGLKNAAKYGAGAAGAAVVGPKLYGFIKSVAQ